MEKFAVIEVGSTNTKSYFYDCGNIIELPQRTIEFKGNYKKFNKLAESDVSQLCLYCNSFKSKTKNIFVYGTSIFRDLSVVEREKFLADFQKQTGVVFNIVTQEQESEYTVKGVILGNDFRGRLAVMIGGGGSTEVCIIENKKIIEKSYNNYGAVTITQKFECINDFKPKLSMNEVDDYCLSLTHRISEKADILVIAGGDFKGFYECAGKDYLEKNKIFEDPLQPYSIAFENADIVDRRFILEQDIKDYYKNYAEYSPAWWNGTRAMRFCVRAVAKRCGAKVIIPTKINMCLGIINELKGVSE